MFCPSGAMYGDVLGGLLAHLAAEEGGMAQACGAQSRRRRGCGRQRDHAGQGARRPCFVPEAPRSVFGARAADVAEDCDAYFIFVDAPGHTGQTVNVTLEGGRLEVSGNAPAEDCGPAALRRRRRSPLKLSWQLPDDVAVDGIEAKLENGELVVTLPKSHAPQPRRFSVPITGPDSQDVPAQVQNTPAEDLPATSSSQAEAQPEQTAAAAPLERSVAPTADVIAAHDSTTAPPVDALADSAATTPSKAGDNESDGSWEDVPDEEEARRKAKGKGLAEGSVLEAIERAQAGTASHDAAEDSD